LKDFNVVFITQVSMATMEDTDKYLNWEVSNGGMLTCCFSKNLSRGVCYIYINQYVGN